MTLQVMARNVLNANRFNVHPNHVWRLDSERIERIAERFRLVWCEPESFWERVEFTVELENGHICPTAYAVELNGTWYHRNELICCQCCDEYEHPDTAYTVRSGGSRQQWCVQCYEDNSFCCTNCQGSFTDDEMTTVDGENYCENCAPDDTNVFGYHSQSRPRIPLSKADYPFWSIELELELSSFNARRAFAESVRNDSRLDKTRNGQIILETDGSLCSEKGVEVIFSLYEDKESILRDIAIVQSYAKENGGISWQLKRVRDRWAGCHINRNRTGWTEHHLMRLCYLVEKLRDLLVILSGRDCSGYAGYSHSYYGTRGRRLRELSRGCQGKYSALNLSSGNRIEWRMFSGSLKPERIASYCAAVEVLENLAQGTEKAQKLEEIATSKLKEIIIKK